MDRSTFRADLMAGITGAVLVLPQGVAFAMIAGLPPIYGLYTAMISPIVAALFGSSMHTVNGPTTAISIVVFSTLQPYAPEGSLAFIELAIVVTFMTGVMQLLLGALKMGSLINFVSNTVVVGFTAGAALLIAVSQIKHFLGLDIPNGLSFSKSMATIVTHLPQTNIGVLLISSTTLIMAILVKALKPRWPNMLIAMVLGSIMAYYVAGRHEEIRFVGELPVGLPPFHIPHFDPEQMRTILSGSFALALLALIQSVAIARSIANRSRQIIDPNQEFIAQGLSNLVGAFFSNYVSGASFTRSAVNYQAGARTPLSAILSAIFVMAIVLFIGPLTEHLPIPVMAGIIMLVAYNLIDFKEIRKILLSNWNEWVILLVTVFCTLFLHLEYAIYSGVILSLVFYLRRTGKPRIIAVAPLQGGEKRSFRNTEIYHTVPCPQLDIIRIDGSLFFGAVDHVRAYLQELEQNNKKNLLILGDGMNFIDLAGAELLAMEAEKRRERGGALYFSGIKKVTRDFLEEHGFRAEIGEERFYMSKKEAIRGIYARLDRSVCATCTARVFLECNADS
ncbi:MAG: SulP family inorganic anion transporter [Flavobacteriales bacterium]|nr:SulP family inorganic anion transporter [Flavobacteriales bacterium]